MVLFQVHRTKHAEVIIFILAFYHKATIVAFRRQRVKRIAHFQRNPDTHVFVLMVSSETREKKPYSLPVQCIPYAGLKEVELCRLVSDLCKGMTSLGLKVSGSGSKMRH